VQNGSTKALCKEGEVCEGNLNLIFPSEDYFHSGKRLDNILKYSTPNPVPFNIVLARFCNIGNIGRDFVSHLHDTQI
jgi:hypothetical protein